MFEPAIPHGAAERPAPAATDQPVNAAPALRVLLAEDTPINAEMMCAMAEHLGVAMDVAENGQDAIDMVRKAAMSGTPYALLLADVMMPVLDGVEATRRLRAEGFTPAELPIIAVTAATSREEVIQYRHAGMQAFLPKPVGLSELSAAIHAWGRSAPRVKPGSQANVWQALRQKFIQRKTNALAQIKAALAADGLDDDAVMELRNMLHQLAGTAGSFGEDNLEMQARKCESALMDAFLKGRGLDRILREACKCLEENQ